MKLGRYLTLVLQKVGTVRQFVSEGKGDFASCASRNWEFANYDRTGKESSFDQELGRGGVDTTGATPFNFAKIGN